MSVSSPLTAFEALPSRPLLEPLCHHLRHANASSILHVYVRTYVDMATCSMGLRIGCRLVAQADGQKLHSLAVKPFEPLWVKGAGKCFLAVSWYFCCTRHQVAWREHIIFPCTALFVDTLSCLQFFLPKKSCRPAIRSTQATTICHRMQWRIMSRSFSLR